jgi:hypothetical protein
VSFQYIVIAVDAVAYLFKIEFCNFMIRRVFLCQDNKIAERFKNVDLF